MLSLCMMTVNLKSLPANDQPRIIRDQYGRHTIYHGVNLVYKVAPYIPEQDEFDSQNSLTDKDIADLQNWGMNLVRLGVMWEAVETSPGVYNNTYLQEIDKMITKLGEAGIYTLIDAHQDVMARAICGEGMPNYYAKEIIANGTYCISEWTDYLLGPIFRKFNFCKPMDDYGWRKDEDGNPLIEDCQKVPFFNYYMTPESWTIFRELWTNKNGLQDKYVAYWDAVSKVLAKNEYVVGYDPTNEPLPSWTSAANFLWKIFPESGHFDRYDLQPMYARIHDIYSQHKNDTYMWFEPAQFPDELGINSYLKFVFDLGFSKPPGGEIGSKHHILNDHTYCCQIVGTCDATGEPQAETAKMCKAWHEKRIGQRNKDAKALGVPLAISEFGACMDGDDCAREITQVADACDEQLASWAYWQFKTFKDLTTTAGDRSEGFYNKDGTLQTKKIKSLTRSYVQYAQGVIQSMYFNTTSGELQNIIKIDTNIPAPTVVYMNVEAEYMETSWYPQGLHLDVKAHNENGPEPDIVKTMIDANHLTITVKNKEFNGHLLSVKISPRQSSDDSGSQNFIQ